MKGKDMNKVFVLVVVFILVVIIGVVVYFGLIPSGIEKWNGFRYKDTITAEMKKEVENTCLSMIASWETDAQTYKENKGIDETVANEARMSANKTAESYNDYILKNGYVFGETLPEGVYAVIEPIE